MNVESTFDESTSAARFITAVALSHFCAAPNAMALTFSRSHLVGFRCSASLSTITALSEWPRMT